MHLIALMSELRSKATQDHSLPKVKQSIWRGRKDILQH